jgi:hypothetical protein
VAEGSDRGLMRGVSPVGICPTGYWVFLAGSSCKSDVFTC